MSPGESPAFIRRATAEDAAVLAALESAAFTSPWSQASLEATLGEPDAAAWLACTAAEGPSGDGFALFHGAAGEAELLRIAVHPEAQRRGLGRALIDHALGELARMGFSLCHLEVRADNLAALALYERTGFRRVGRRPRYYPDRCDALLLRRG